MLYYRKKIVLLLLHVADCKSNSVAIKVVANAVCGTILTQAQNDEFIMGNKFYCSIFKLEKFFFSRLQYYFLWETMTFLKEKSYFSEIFILWRQLYNALEWYFVNFTSIYYSVISTHKGTKTLKIVVYPFRSYCTLLSRFFNY